MNDSVITLDAGLKSELNWKQALEKADQRDQILWELDFSLHDIATAQLHDPAHFQALKLSIEHFCQTVLEPFAEKTKGVMIYSGPLDFLKNLHSIDEETYASWKKEFGLDLVDEAFAKKIWARDLFAVFFALLVQHLPDDLPLYLSLDAKGLTAFEIAILASKACFPYFNLSLKNAGEWFEKGISASDGLILPETKALLQNDCAPLVNVLEQSIKEQKPLRLVPEEELTTSWNGLDRIFVLPTTVSKEGRRKFLGFEAAGGKTIFV